MSWVQNALHFARGPVMRVWDHVVLSSIRNVIFRMDRGPSEAKYQLGYCCFCSLSQDWCEEPLISIKMWRGRSCISFLQEKGRCPLLHNWNQSIPTNMTINKVHALNWMYRTDEEHLQKFLQRLSFFSGKQKTVSSCYCVCRPFFTGKKSQIWTEREKGGGGEDH